MESSTSACGHESYDEPKTTNQRGVSLIQCCGLIGWRSQPNMLRDNAAKNRKMPFNVYLTRFCLNLARVTSFFPVTLYFFQAILQ